jgi:hypothetical protein
MKRAVWLSYDLGIQGNYESLYQWLDIQGAIECGENVAFFKFETDESKDVVDQIKEQLENVIKADSNARIYVVRRDKGEIRGRFIFGQRKAAPWTGYAPKPATEEHE